MPNDFSRYNLGKMLRILAVTLGLLTVGMQTAGLFTMEVKDGKMSSCVLTANIHSMCPMSASDHLARWQQTFVVAQSPSPLLLLLLSAVVLTVSAFLSNILVDLLALALLVSQRYRKREPHYPFFDFIRQALSHGILQPVLYA